MNRISTLLAVSLAAASLTACSSVRNTFGGNSQTPDEMAVVRQAPLVIPPDFTLRPPRPGAPRPMELDAQGQALEALFGPGVAVPGRSAGEQALLDKAGAAKASPDIRSTLRDDGTVVADKGVFLKEVLATQSGVKAVDGVDIQPGDQTGKKKKK
jgi:Protein of unknown function (DUF3035)